MHNLESLLNQSNELPSLPEIYLKVSELLESEHSTAYQIGDAVQTDPSLTSRILKMVNSAYYGLPHQVSSISQAVTLLGRQHLHHILMGSMLAGMFSDVNNPNFSMREFWDHSIKTAIIARHLAMQNANIIDHDAFFTAGLLHDIGRLVIANLIPDSFLEIDELVKIDKMEIIQAETETLGFSHVDISERLIDKWGLPEMLIQCAAKHHEEEHSGQFAIDTSIIYLANQLSQHPPPMDEEDAQIILEKIPNWQQAKCTLEQISVALQLADDQSHEVMVSLGMIDMEINDDFF